jgi:hypothetical protein
MYSFICLDIYLRRQLIFGNHKLDIINEVTLTVFKEI